MSKKRPQKNKLIPSYTREDFFNIGMDNTLFIAIEKGEGVFRQVKLNNEEFNEVCRIINKSKLGFSVTTVGEPFVVEPFEEI